MLSTLPGTVLPITEETSRIPFSALTPFFTVAKGGISLSQLAGITGLNASTIQNWVKRGWVSHPEGKRYGPRQVARVLLINLMRPVMQLEHITMLLSYINGRVDDESDDIIAEPTLYNLLACAVMRMEACRSIGEDEITGIAAEVISENPPKQAEDPAARERLSHAVLQMLYNIAAARFLRYAAALKKE